MKVKKVLTIAGSDSGGGAGIQADLKTFAALGVYGTCAITAVTAQNTRGVWGIHPLPADFVGLQIDAVAADIGADAVKTGMLFNAEIIAVVAAKLKEHKLPHLVVDPVMVAGSGERLLQEEAIASLVELLIPLAEVTTPNLEEARILSGLVVESVEDMKKAAKAIHKLGARYVVVKGGHLEGRAESVDVLFDGEDFWEFASPRVEAAVHGAGCTFASAIAAELAKGRGAPEAVRAAKDYTTMALRRALHIGKGRLPLSHFALL